MSNETVVIEGRSRDNATLLIAAAREIGVDETLIRTTTSGYIVPKEVAEVAFPDKAEDKPAPRKRAAKKTASAKSEPKE
jgi:hypothetical protein